MPKQVTKKELEEYAKKEHNFTAIAKDAMDPAFNPDDRELTMALWKSSVDVAKMCAPCKTVMCKHARAAHAAYETLAHHLSLEAPEDELTKKALREQAVEKEVLTKVSPEAIEAVFDKNDPVLSLAVWNVAISLASNKELKDTKTLMPIHAQTAKSIYMNLRPLLEEDDGAVDGDNDPNDAAAANDNGVQEDPDDEMQTDDDDNAPSTK